MKHFSGSTTEDMMTYIKPPRDNLNGKSRRVNIFIKKFCMENDFVYVNHDNIKPRQHCNYGEIHLNTLGSKILADNFILALNALT